MRSLLVDLNNKLILIQGRLREGSETASRFDFYSLLFLTCTYRQRMLDMTHAKLSYRELDSKLFVDVFDIEIYKRSKKNNIQ